MRARAASPSAKESAAAPALAQNFEAQGSIAPRDGGADPVPCRSRTPALPKSPTAGIPYPSGEIVLEACDKGLVNIDRA